MMEGVFGFSQVKRELKTELVNLRRETLSLRRSTKVMQYEVAKYRYGNGEVSRTVLFLISLGLLILPIKYNLLLWSYMLRATIGIGLGTAGTSIGVASVAGVVMVSSTTNHKEPVSAIPKVEAVAVESHTQTPPVESRRVDPVIKTDPIFKPKFATVVLITNESFECKIINFTADYIEAIVNGEKKIIPQKDIYEIRGM